LEKFFCFLDTMNRYSQVIDLQYLHLYLPNLA
jgi:hypothetical protein